jgi:DNA polymerase III sliding clamp (beta) subunit (PCNA family)
MQFKIQQSVLCDVLKRASYATGDKQDLPGFSGVRLDIIGSWARLSTFNPLAAVEAVLPLGVPAAQDGSFGLTLSVFASVVESLDDELIEFTLGEAEVQLKNKKSRFKLKLRADVPNFPQHDMARFAYQELKVADFLADLKRVIYCRDDKSDIMWKKSAYVSDSHIVSTDGYRMSFMPNRHKCSVFNNPLLLTATSIEKLIKVYAGLSGTSGIACDGSTLFIHSSGIYTGVRLPADRRYPNFQAVMPKDLGSIFQVSRQELLSAFKRVMMLSTGEDYSPVDLGFFPGRGAAIELMTTNADGQGSEAVSAKGSGVPGNVRVNGVHILKALTKMDGEQVKVHHYGPGEKVIIADGEHINVFQPVFQGRGLPGE